METFKLDTSGFVENPDATAEPEGLRWTDLDAFTQGYVEALFAHVFRDDPDSEDENGLWPDWPASDRPAGFSDLAPETLAAMLRDCERLLEIGNRPGARGWDEGRAREQGAGFWVGRQGGVWAPTFPPLTLSLGDDGLIYARAAQ